MNITFLGGADEVGASSILIEIGGRRLLIDAGIRPTPKARWGLAGDQLPDLSLIDAQGGLDAILVTHAHTDHTGALELVLEQYPDVPVYATPVTVELTRVLHADARRIMQMRLEEEGELPLYDEVATTRLLAAFRPVAFNQPLTLAPGLTATFFLAGHIAGAAMIGLAAEEGRVLISGDISIDPQRTVDGARPPAFSPDVLVLESTYGGRLHANRLAEERRLVDSVAQVVEQGGKVLIPAFALGRAQEVLLTLGEFQRQGELAPVPIWADGMVRAICQAYSSFPDALPLPLQEQGAQFYTEQIRPVQSSAQRNALIWEAGPAVIVSSSGMLAGGPSMAYARALAGKAENAILLTGYQDEEAPGRRLQEMARRGHGTLRLGDKKVDVQCELGTYSLSAHADTGQLVSFVETLDPTQIYLVHGDEDARHSLVDALKARGRTARTPRAGQDFGLSFRPATSTQPRRAVGRGRPLDLRRLWEAVTEPAKQAPESDATPLITLDELARIWWGDRHAADADRLSALAAALKGDDRYFTSDRMRPETYRIRSRAQVQLANRRRREIAAHGDLTDRWLLVRDPAGEPRVAQTTAVALDHLVVKVATQDEAKATLEGATFPVWPEDILAVLDDADQAKAALARMAERLEAEDVDMEPNRALALAKKRFPPAARLRRAGYRLAERVLALAFDFPDVATERYAAELAALAAETGWRIEVAPEANQAALSALATECLPAGWNVRKGPAIHRSERCVTMTVAPDGTLDHELDPKLLDEAEDRYEAESGYRLEIEDVDPVDTYRPKMVATADEPMEINAAYGLIRQALAGTSLYRTGLKGGAIVLSFISPQAGERHRQQIDALAEQVGWPLRIHPQPNQNAILDAARRLLQEQGWQTVKGPSIFTDRAEVTVTLAETLDADALTAVRGVFEDETGYRLGIASANQPTTPAPTVEESVTAVEIPIDRIRLQAMHQGLALNPAKLNKALTRTRRDGVVRPPIHVRRLRDAYLLLDGLYRLRAAQTLGHTRIRAEIEG